MALSYLKKSNAQNLTSSRAWQGEAELLKKRRSVSSLNGKVLASGARQQQQQRTSPNSPELTESELEYGDIIALPPPPPVPAYFLQRLEVGWTHGQLHRLIYL